MNEAVVRLLERPRVYLAWQRPFVASKLGPVWRHTDRASVRRVLDVGCGPGTNSSEFAGLDYLGVDLSPSYIAHARRRHEAARFVVADVRTGAVPAEGTYDFVLVNSLLHHLDDDAAELVLEALHRYVSSDGHIHVIEVVLPERRGIPRMLALGDRGDHSRSCAVWRELLGHHFDEVVFEPFAVPARGPMLWSMVYFKGSPKRNG
jgi:SAM-dependent methyltransferase